MAVSVEASSFSLPDLEAKHDQDANGKIMFFHKMRTDVTHVPEDEDDAVHALDGDHESDDEADILVDQFSTDFSFSTVASNRRLRLSHKIFLKDADLDDKSPWASPVGAMLSGGGSFRLEDDFAASGPEAQVPEQLAPSKGSEQHGSGNCKPCAWFWKPQGCQNGWECLHCHLCPKSEVKARKKDKARQRKEQAKVLQPVQNEVTVVDFKPPPGLAPPPGLSTPADPLELSQVQAPAELPLLVPGERQLELEEDEEVLDRQPGNSMGAALHASGLCKPCAWFWKLQGCANGEGCLHCHLCPAGEVKRRKKQKKVSAQKRMESEEVKELSAPPSGAMAAAVAVQLQQQQMLIQQQQQQLLEMHLQLRMQEQQMTLFAGSQAIFAATASQVPGKVPCAPLRSPQAFGA